MSDLSPGRKSVIVEIAGERHVLRSDASPEYTGSVAAHVDAAIRSISLGNVLEPHRAAILAALTVTDDLFRTRSELATLREEHVRARRELEQLREQYDTAREELQALREEIVRRSSRVAYLLERAVDSARQEDGVELSAPLTSPEV
ncbi:MAG: cell division protein ZapA [Gemmatimonadota bacterium]|jgi:cell division protein ZapA|nr:cell division protein ZapA [Gemmatimonadota bacterium]